MAAFHLIIPNVDVHGHSPRAHRLFICAALDQAKQAIGSGPAASGDLAIPEAGEQKVIGSWKIQE
jgi:hypothetical protein